MLQEGQNITCMVFLETFLLEASDYLERTHWRTVGSGSRHGVINVGNCDDLCKRINRIFCQTGWISRSVTAFVMHQSRFFDTGIDILVFQDIISIAGMLLDLLEFFVGKSARFI